MLCGVWTGASHDRDNCRAITPWCTADMPWLTSSPVSATVTLGTMSGFMCMQAEAICSLQHAGSVFRAVRQAANYTDLMH